jgi:hypothetical protein
VHFGQGVGEFRIPGRINLAAQSADAFLKVFNVVFFGGFGDEMEQPFTGADIFLKRELIVRSVLVAFRQGFLVAILVTIILFLASHHILNTLNIILLILGLSALEFLLLSFESDHSETI